MKAKLTEMKNADVRFVSMVSRGANRIPFRIVKKEKESPMIDLTNPMRILKAAKPAAPVEVTPSVVGIVVQTAGSDVVSKEVSDALEASGFSVANAIKNDDGTTLYAQFDGAVTDEIMGGTHLVRLSEDMLVVVKGFSPYSDSMDSSSDFSEVMATQGFYQGVRTASDALSTVIMSTLRKADSGSSAASDLQATMGKFTTYITSLVTALPTSAFKADQSVTEIMKAAKNRDGADDMAGQDEIDQEALSVAEANAGEGKELEAVQIKNLSKKSDESESVEKGSKKKPMADDESTESTPDDESAEMTPQEKFKKMVADKAKAKKEDADALAEAIKSEVSPILEALKALTETLEATTKSQKTLQDQVDLIARKAENTSKAIKSTVIGTARGDDEATLGLTTTSKAESGSDPRTGCFDSAFLPRRK